MRTPSIVPHDAERDTYLVLDDFGGRLGCAWRQQRLTVPGSTYAEAWIEATFQIAWSRFALPPCTPPGDQISLPPFIDVTRVSAT
jgi:hypothetical protein